MKINVSIETDAMGCISRTGFQLNPEQLPCDITNYLPPQYQEYVGRIWVELDSEHLVVNGQSIAPTGSFRKEKIGLSYATCDISVSILNND